MADLAASLGREKLGRERGSVEAGSSLVHALITLNRPNLAANLARDIAKVGILLPEIAQSVADAFARLALYDEAYLHYRRMLCLHPQVARGSANLAETLARTGDAVRSLIWAERACLSDPADDQAAVHHAMALMTAGQIALGLAEYEARLRPGAVHAPERRGLSEALTEVGTDDRCDGGWRSTGGDDAEDERVSLRLGRDSKVET